MLQKIKELAELYKEECISIRHHLHQHPEMSLQEFETSAFIQAKLNEYKIPFKSKIAGTGISAMIKGKNPEKKLIALRADMDALPIEEKNNVSYKSVNARLMHACGHDVHMASLLITAKILNELKDEWEGTVQLIFQPSEEKLPGGASLMIKEGLFKDRLPDAIIAQHVFPSLQKGMFGFREGKYMASSDEVYFTIKGKGGHAALPKEIINPLFDASHLLIAMENLIVELQQQSVPTILSFGKINGSGATNVVPDEVTIEGTFRTMDEAWRKEIHQKIRGAVKNTFSKLRSTCEINIVDGYPCLINNPEITDMAMKSAIEFAGQKNIVDLDLRMTSEDFAYYSQIIPSCFYRLGTGNSEKNIVSQVHTPTFDIDEDVLELAPGMMAWIAYQEMIQ